MLVAALHLLTSLHLPAYSCTVTVPYQFAVYRLPYFYYYPQPWADGSSKQTMIYNFTRLSTRYLRHTNQLSKPKVISLQIKNVHSLLLRNCIALKSDSVKSMSMTNESATEQLNSSSKPKPKVYVTRRVPSKGIEILKQHCEVTQWNNDDPVPKNELRSKLKGVDALFCLLSDKIDRDMITSAGISESPR